MTEMHQNWWQCGYLTCHFLGSRGSTPISPYPWGLIHPFCSFFSRTKSDLPTIADIYLQSVKSHHNVFRCTRVLLLLILKVPAKLGAMRRAENHSGWDHPLLPSFINLGMYIMNGRQLKAKIFPRIHEEESNILLCLPATSLNLSDALQLIFWWWSYTS